MADQLEFAVLVERLEVREAFHPLLPWS